MPPRIFSDTFSLSAIILFSFLAFAGCLDPGPGRLETTLHAFDAQYGSGEETLAIEMTGGYRILDRDGSHRDAYRIRVDGSKILETFYDVDSSFRIIREFTDCVNEEMNGVCMTLFDWRAQGQPAPYGIGLPWVWQQQGDRLTTVVGGEDHTWNLSSERSSSGRSSLVVDGPARSWNALNGTYRYEEGTLVPTEIALGEDTYRLTGYQRGDAVAVVSGPTSGHEPRPGLDFQGIFPGSEWVPPGGVASMQEAFAALLEHSAEAETIWSNGGCVVEAGTSDFAEPSVPGQPLTTDQSFRISLADPQGTVTEFALEVTETGPFRNWSVEERGTEQGEPCSDSRRSPSPAIVATDFFAAAEGFPISHEGAHVYLWRLAPEGPVPEELPENGWNDYVVAFVPKDLSNPRLFAPYGVQFDANKGIINTITAAASDRERLDEGPDLVLPSAGGGP